MKRAKLSEDQFLLAKAELELALKKEERQARRLANISDELEGSLLDKHEGSKYDKLDGMDTEDCFVYLVDDLDAGDQEIWHEGGQYTVGALAEFLAGRDWDSYRNGNPQAVAVHFRPGSAAFADNGAATLYDLVEDRLQGAINALRMRQRAGRGALLYLEAAWLGHKMVALAMENEDAGQEWGSSSLDNMGTHGHRLLDGLGDWAPVGCEDIPL